LIATVKVLLAVNAAPERPRRVTLLLDALRTQKGPGAIPLLAALDRRFLLDPSAAVREQAARTLRNLLQADHLDQPCFVRVR